MPSESSFEDTTDQLQDWARGRSRPLAIGALVVAALGAGAFFWKSSADGKAARAEAAYFQAQAPIAQNDLAGAERELRSVADRFQGTAGGAQARLLLAQVLYEQGKYQAGVDVLKAADAPASLRTSTKVLMAGGQEGLGKAAEAAKLYEEAAAESPIGQRDELRANAARAYQTAGNAAAAQRIWTELSRNESSPLADEARVRLGELAGKPAS
ncbi:tetratricopeptide repeat protein [Roseisolibacter sp. H3M3-2]|uniref:tetratricopeptide repeat protein n=1 Tax=Roseisolibacter sp. H3M3-2 TaxID=3031323 RepID=UPI0023D9E7CE|nr:tetratricopeptide repeat protein [Roseisolibacter sp. H3M3-2]MDF1502629.1 tetratricopeptide repeat protein [Roseisolibacter sp. H3M3-2]